MTQKNITFAQETNMFLIYLIIKIVLSEDMLIVVLIDMYTCRSMYVSI